MESQIVGFYDTEEQITVFLRSVPFSEGEKEGVDVPSVGLDTILLATDKFSEENKLGQGGFGPVYKVKNK